MERAMTDPLLWTSFATIAGLWVITVVSPGPNFFATAHTAVAVSRRDGLLVAAGVALGTLLWATVSLLGLGVLFQTAGWLYQAVKLIGAAYLIYVGARMLLGAWRGSPAGRAASAAQSVAGARAFRFGLLTDLSNPKAAAFFTSLFAVTIPPGAPLWFDALIVSAVVAIAGGWYALAACLVSFESVARLYRRGQRAIGAVTGAVFMALGLRLGLSER